VTAGLAAIGLHRRFGRRVVVHDLSIRVAPGEVVGLLGPNGAGKTTTFQMLAGLLKPHGGQVYLDGTELTRWPLWRRARAGLGYVPQRPTVFPRLTVAQNLELSLRGRPKGERATARDALLARFGLEGLAHQRGGQLSVGERRRVELVRAMGAAPRALLCDEPFAGLEPLAVATMGRQLRRMADQGVGVLITDHDVGQALAVCDRIYILTDGTLLQTGTPAEIVHDARVQAAYLGTSFTSAAGMTGKTTGS
jgi:lipopolysaccharide export system ATP-binding protein